MGCAASTTASVPAQQPNGQMHVEGSGQQQQQQPNARPVAMNQLQRPAGQQQPAGNRGGNLKNAPVVKSLVDLKRENVVIESAKDGCFVRLRFATLTAGEITAFFNVTETSEGDEKTMPSLDSVEVSRQHFSAGSSQTARLRLCQDLEAGLSNFTEAKERHHVVVELKADSSDPKAITVQRSYLKLNGDRTGAQVTSQKVRCGPVVRTLQALYGTMPNPKDAMDNANSGDMEGECVICLSKPREVAILHCRHVCLCRSCATITSSTWSFQCPVCRGRVAAMVGMDAV